MHHFECKWKHFSGGSYTPPPFYHVAASNFNSGCSIQSYWIPWECHSWTSPGRTYVDLWFCCHQVWGISSCNNVAPVTNLCLGRVTTRSHSSQWSKKKSWSWNIKTHYLRFKHFIITITDDPSPCQIGLAEKYMLFKGSNNLLQIYRSFAITGNYGRQSFSKYGISYYTFTDGWCKHSRLKSPNMVSTSK